MTANTNPHPHPSPSPSPNLNQVLAVTAGHGPDLEAAMEAIRASDAREISSMSRQVEALQARLASAKKGGPYPYTYPSILGPIPTPIPTPVAGAPRLRQEGEGAATGGLERRRLG